MGPLVTIGLTSVVLIPFGGLALIGVAGMGAYKLIEVERQMNERD